MGKGNLDCFIVTNLEHDFQLGEERERVPMEIAMLSRCQKVSGVIDLIEWVSVPDGFLIVSLNLNV